MAEPEMWQFSDCLSEKPETSENVTGNALIIQKIILDVIRSRYRLAYCDVDCYSCYSCDFEEVLSAVSTLQEVKKYVAVKSEKIVIFDAGATSLFICTTDSVGDYLWRPMFCPSSGFYYVNPQLKKAYDGAYREWRKNGMVGPVLPLVIP